MMTFSLLSFTFLVYLVNDRQQAIIKTSNSMIDDMTSDIYMLYEKVESLSFKITEKERAIYYLSLALNTEHILIETLQKEINIYRDESNREKRTVLYSTREFIKKYGNLHDSIQYGDDPKRFIIADMIGGYGNRIFGLVSAFLISIMTDRALVITCPILKENMDFPFKGMTDMSSASKADRIESLVYQDTCYFEGNDIGETLSKITDFNQLSSAPVVHFITNCPLFHWIVKNPEVQRKMQEYGIVDRNGNPLSSFDVLGFFQNLMRPKPFLKQFIDNKVSQWRKENDIVIGLQIRVGTPPTGNITSSFVDNGYYLRNENFEMIWNHSFSLTKNHNRPKYFLATDSDIVVNMSKTIYKENITFFDGVIIHSYQDQSPSGIAKVLVDNYLLSETDEIIMTSGSTFGAIAAARKGTIPYYIFIDDNECKLSSRDKSPGKQYGNQMSLMW